MAVLLPPPTVGAASPSVIPAIAQARALPRLRFMGSKARVVPTLIEVFAALEGECVLDAFSGSGAVAYALKALGRRVTANDFLAFPTTIARASIANSATTLDERDVARILSPNLDGRDFIRSTFEGLYFPDSDLAFLDAAWSHIATIEGAKRDLALSALILAAARKQPRGVFTVTDFRYDDGRRQLREPLRDLFAEAVGQFNRAVFDNGLTHTAMNGDVFDVPPVGFDIVYLDPPYAPPRDDNDYIKRYHFLEGLACYWEGQTILMETKSKKLAKRFTPFAYKRTIRDALRRVVTRFAKSTIVLSYSSNSVPGEDEVVEILREVKGQVDVYAVPHRYSFGTHATALRREASEFIFVAR